MAVRDLSKRILRRKSPSSGPLTLSFGAWDRFPAEHPKIVQICHPQWRGVRTVAHSFRSPVVECDDLDHWSDELADRFSDLAIDMVVLQGWPPGSANFANRMSAGGLMVKCVLHSSPAQQGAEAGEAAVVDEVLLLAQRGILREVAMAKLGAAPAFTAAGHPVTYLPNRVPLLPDLKKVDLGSGLHIGVFAEPFWRKNVVTQLLAVSLLDDAVAHVIRRPDVSYLDGLQIVEHGELPWDDFVALQGSVDLNLYVTLSECHPSTPQESYLAGVPCLVSRVSGVFKDDPRLWEITTTDLLDDPQGIAESATKLMVAKDEAVERANSWMRAHDLRAERLWQAFTKVGSA